MQIVGKADISFKILPKKGQNLLAACREMVYKNFGGKGEADMCSFVI
jgi:hypothetical protein